MKFFKYKFLGDLKWQPLMLSYCFHFVDEMKTFNEAIIKFNNLAVRKSSNYLRRVNVNFSLL